MDRDFSPSRQQFDPNWDRNNDMDRNRFNPHNPFPPGGNGGGGGGMWGVEEEGDVGRTMIMPGIVSQPSHMNEDLRPKTYHAPPNKNENTIQDLKPGEVRLG